MTLTDFLLARIAEDEANAHGFREHGRGEPYNFEMGAIGLEEPMVYMRFALGARRELTQAEFREEFMEPAVINPRLLAECEAKRRIVDLHPLAVLGSLRGCAGCQWDLDGNTGYEGDCETLLALASVYADHEGYRQEWRP